MIGHGIDIKNIECDSEYVIDSIGPVSVTV
jgi:hypothetical protein